MFLIVYLLCLHGVHNLHHLIISVVMQYNNHQDQHQEAQATNHQSLPKKSTRKKTAPFVDNRAKTVAQRKLQETANNSPQVKKTAQLQAIADNHVAQSQHSIQKKENYSMSVHEPKRTNNTGLPDNLKSGIENLSGYTMDDVKVHYNSDKPAQLQAHAYAQGTDIHLGSRQEKHLPHEAWHVVQQKQGRVKPTIQMKGKVNVNDDAGLEKEADVMGSNALKIVPDEQNTVDSTLSTSSTLQKNNSVISSLSSTVQLAGDPEGMLPKHPEGGIAFTFHHIIPENKLKAAWNKIKESQQGTNPLEDPQNKGSMLSGFEATLKKGYSTFFDSAVLNIQNDLEKEFSPRYLNYLKDGVVPSSEKILTIVKKLCNPANNEIKTSTDAAKLVMAEDHQNDLEDVRDSFNKWTKAVDVTEDTAKSVETSISDNETLQHMIEWLPGNIHRGPTNRIAPGGSGYNADIDDGGANFETSAQHLVTAEHWRALLALDTAIDNVTTEANQENIIALSTALETLSKYSLTEYDEAKWKLCEVEGRQGKYEIIPGLNWKH